METPHRSTFLAIYGSFDSAVNLMKESHSGSIQCPVLGESTVMGPRAVVKLMGYHLKESLTFWEKWLFMSVSMH